MEYQFKEFSRFAKQLKFKSEGERTKDNGYYDSVFHDGRIVRRYISKRQVPEIKTNGICSDESTKFFEIF